MEGFIMAAQMILALSILVAVHEFGHFITAKMFKIRVDKFYVFFDFLFPMPNVLNFALFKVKGKETEYGLGWFPLGGYVKIAGMMDESMDKEQLEKDPEPDEFRSKPAWQRLIVMLGGVLVNVIVGVIIFIFIVYGRGDTYLPASEVKKHGIVANDIAQNFGLQTGDVIINVNGKPYDRFRDLYNEDILLDNDNYYTVKRNGKEVKIPIPNDLATQLQRNREQILLEPIQKFTVDSVIVGSAAEKAGLKKGDEINKVDKVEINYFHEVQKALRERKNKEITLTITRNEKTEKLQAKVSQDGRLGFYPKFDLETVTQDYSFGEAIYQGTAEAFGVIFTQIRGFGKIFRGDIPVSESLQGPIGIARVFGGTWNWGRFWFLTGLLSMVLAFMNMLPIPALDGGHVIFITYEIISGRKPSEKFLEVSQRIGMILLLLLMVFAIFNDTFRAIRDSLF